MEGGGIKYWLAPLLSILFTVGFAVGFTCSFMNLRFHYSNLRVNAYHKINCMGAMTGNSFRAFLKLHQI